MINFLVVTHGEFGAYMVEAAESIVGRQAAGVRAVAVSPRTGVAEIRERIRESLDSLACGDGVIVFVDMPAGTPVNVSFPQLKGRSGVEMVSGLNLYMLVSAFSHRGRLTLSQMLEKVLRDGQGSVCDVRKIFDALISRQGA